MTNPLRSSGALSEPARLYLTQLEAALAGVDESTSGEILAGVREELLGLDATAAASRLRELGDPAFIAAEARDALSSALPTASTPEKAGRSRREPAWFAVVAGLLVMIGGFVVPVLGAVAGYVMMWFSNAWTRRQKVVATATPFVVIAVLGAVIFLLPILFPLPNGGAYEAGAAQNPLMYAPYDLITTGMLLLALVQIGIGIWLLVAARRGRLAADD